MSLSLAQRTTGAGSGSPAWELIAGAQGARIKQLGVSLVAATATTLGVGYPAAIGVTPTTPVAFVDSETGADGIIAGALAWGTPPTSPTKFLQRISLPATIGAFYLFDFTKTAKGGLVIPKLSSFVLWNLAANSVLDAWAIVEQ